MDVLSEDSPRMDAKLAESLVRKWQFIKSQALGPDHCLEKLSEVRQFLVYMLHLDLGHLLHQHEHL